METKDSLKIKDIPVKVSNKGISLKIDVKSSLNSQDD